MIEKFSCPWLMRLVPMALFDASPSLSICSWELLSGCVLMLRSLWTSLSLCSVLLSLILSIHFSLSMGSSLSLCYGSTLSLSLSIHFSLSMRSYLSLSFGVTLSLRQLLSKRLLGFHTDFWRVRCRLENPREKAWLKLCDGKPIH